MIKELSSLAPKLGAGFSRILSKLEGPEILDMLNGSSANKTSATGFHQIPDEFGYGLNNVSNLMNLTT
jgi:hypothetical protein